MTSSAGNKFKFSENLWDGFDLLCKRTESDLQQSKTILMFFKKRAELEDQHAKKLEKLAAKLVSQNEQLETSTTNNGWKKIVNSTVYESEQHQLFNGSILNKVCMPFQAMIKDMEGKRKKIVTDGTRLRVDMKEMIDALRKSQAKYEKVSKDLELTKLEIKDLREQPDSSQDSIAKLERKRERLESEQAANDDEYKEQIKATNDFQNLYNVELMPKILNDFEHFMITHIHLTRTYWVNWTKIITDLPPVYSQSYDGVRRLIEQIDNQNDVQDFIKKNQMKKVVGTPFQYEPYVEGKLTRKSVWNTKTLRDQFFSSKPKKDEATLSPTGSAINFKPTIKEPILPTASYAVALEELMNKQRESHPTLEVPRVLVVLAEVICKLKGHIYEGIFRVPGIVSSIKEYRLQIDRGNFDSLSAIDDVRTPAALFKQWLRDIPEPVIPQSLYQDAITNPNGSLELIKRIPAINLKVLSYLLNFIQIFCRYEFVAHSKMGSSNMAMIFAPTILRCPSNDPSVMLNNVNHEKAFVEHLIQNFPHAEREFLGLPVSPSDAILEEDGDIEELLVDDDDDDMINNVKSDGENEVSTPDVTSNITSSTGNLSLSGGSTTISNNNDPITTNNNTTGADGSSPVLSSSTSSTTTTTSSSSTPTTILTNVTPSSGNRRSSAQLGWVRVRPGQQQQQPSPQ